MNDQTAEHGGDQDATEHRGGVPRDNGRAIPRALIRPRRVSLAWVVPVIALLVVGAMLWMQVSREHGRRITIRFPSAAGLEPGSRIMLRGVSVGVVRDITLDADLRRVAVEAELVPGAERIGVQGSRFWLVHPQVSLTKIAGLDTIIGPRYIAVAPGDPDGPIATSFEALADPPIERTQSDGALRLILRAPRLGSISPGSPVLYREIPIGAVRAARLSPDARTVRIEIGVEPRYAPLVREQSRFWRSGGVGVDFGLFKGLSVQADSLQTVLSASISLATPEKKWGEIASQGAEYDLAETPDEDWLKWSPALEVGE